MNKLLHSNYKIYLLTTLPSPLVIYIYIYNYKLTHISYVEGSKFTVLVYFYGLT